MEPDTDPVYLDHNATTPVDPRVAEAMAPWILRHPGNPSSFHLHGRRARRAVERAREQVAALIGARADEILFTGCATEANNLALRGAALALGQAGLLVTGAIEHPSVFAPCRLLAASGWRVQRLAVDGEGRVTQAELEARIAAGERPALVSLMHANNETGVLQPVEEAARMARARGALVHTDAAQSVGKVPVDVDALGVDLLTLAGHKFYAPKGVGALYVRRGTPLAPLLVGGGQERGLRPGTENVPWIVGLGAAAELAAGLLAEEQERLRRLRDRLHARLAASVPGLTLNGHRQLRLPGTLNLSFPGVEGRRLLAAVENVLSASVGSACHEPAGGASGVLGAMGRSAEEAAGAVRLSVGRFTTEAEVDRAAEALAAAWSRLAAGGGAMMDDPI